MLIVLAILFGATAGILAHYTVPARTLRGVVVVPAVGAVVGGGVWTLMTWLGATSADPWIWILSIAAPLAASYVAAGALAVVRRRRDARRSAALGLA